MQLFVLWKIIPLLMQQIVRRCKVVCQRPKATLQMKINSITDIHGHDAGTGYSKSVNMVMHGIWLSPSWSCLDSFHVRNNLAAHAGDGHNLVRALNQVPALNEYSNWLDQISDINRESGRSTCKSLRRADEAQASSLQHRFEFFFRSTVWVGC